MLLGIAKRPDFIALNFLGCDIAACCIVQLRTSRASIHKKLCHSIDRHILDAGNAPHRGTFAEYI
jgi:hypothetical protein